MTEKLTWAQIKAAHPDEWVQLVDYDWETGYPAPKAGVVRLHAKGRRELHELIMANPTRKSAVLYTGKIRSPFRPILTFHPLPPAATKP